MVMQMFTEWKIIDKKDETPLTKTIRFESKIPVQFKPGQYFLIHDLVEGIQDCRAYSISSSPTRTYFEITVKRVANPFFSKHLHEAPNGHVVESEGPMGDFFFEDRMTDIVLIGAGSGMAPLHAIIQYVHDKKLNTQITMICSDKTKDQLIFYEELKKLGELGKIKLVATLTQEENKSRITLEHLKSAVSDFTKPTFFICGPPLMVEGTISMLKQCGASQTQIRSEKY